MAGRTRPKFPHRGRRLRNRLLVCAAILLAAALAAWFLLPRPALPPGPSSNGSPYSFSYSFPWAGVIPGPLQGNATDSASAPSRSPRSAPAAPSGQPTPQAAPQASSSSARPSGASSSTPPEARTFAAPQAVPPSAPQAAPQAVPQSAAQSAPADPFAGQSLADVSAYFTRMFAGQKPREWGERLPGITSRLPSRAAGAPPRMALTLDACGGPPGSGYDAGIIAFLRQHKIPATIFVTSIWIRNHPREFRELAADPLFEMEAHGSRHKPASVNGRSVYGIKGTISPTELVYEVENNARDIVAAGGARPRWFRSGTAFYDEIAVSIIRRLGLGIAGYSIAADQGATLPAAKVAAKVLAAKDGDIILVHLNHPASGTREGLQKSLPRLLEQGTVFVRLSDAAAP